MCVLAQYSIVQRIISKITHDSLTRSVYKIRTHTQLKLDCKCLGLIIVHSLHDLARIQQKSGLGIKSHWKVKVLKGQFSYKINEMQDHSCRLFGESYIEM